MQPWQPITGTARIYFFTQVLALLALIAVLPLGLLTALLSGLLVYELTESGARFLMRAKIPFLLGKMIVLLLLILAVAAALTQGVAAFAAQFMDGPESLVTLLQKMADVVDSGRAYLPLWTQQYLPANIEEWQVEASEWLRDNARDLSEIGREAGIFLGHLIIGMIIGAMVALNPGTREEPHGPFAKALRERVTLLGRSFRRVVFSQIRISALNTLLTAIFLIGVLPLIGAALPLTKTMIAVTFFAGLLPIIGNLISNTVIFLIALSVSPAAAVGSLIYLILIHKLEYFVNARIIGTQIRARAWEVLITMLVMEAAFGIAGVIAAPIYYSYLKDELAAQKLI